MSLQLAASKEVQVNESDQLVDTGIRVTRGDTLMIHAWGSIWAGVWFTGPNGPRGWPNIDLDNKFPLPGTHPFSLIGKLDAGYFYVGDTYRQDQTPDQGQLFLRTNDDVPGNGSGAFQCLVQLYRDM